jgi:hypothetical protein
MARASLAGLAAPDDLLFLRGKGKLPAGIRCALVGGETGEYHRWDGPHL